MAAKFRPKYLLLLTVFASSVVNAGTYVGLAATMVQIKTDTGSTKPLAANLSLGYAKERHKIELAVMTGVSDDNLNQLVTDIPIATSLLYHYTVNPRSSTSIDLILGYSQVDIKSSYIQIPEFTETFSGVSFGIGFEEALKSIPQLKFKLDIMQLYRGDQLKINAYTMGFRYAF